MWWLRRCCHRCRLFVHNRVILIWWRIVIINSFIHCHSMSLISLSFSIIFNNFFIWFVIILKLWFFFYNINWFIAEINITIAFGCNFHGIFPNQCRNRATGQSYPHFWIVIISNPNTKNNIRCISDKPSIFIVISSSGFSGCRFVYICTSTGSFFDNCF